MKNALHQANDDEMHLLRGQVHWMEENKKLTMSVIY